MHIIERPGQGPAVVCIHGYCQSSAYWTPTLDRVAERGVHALAMDLPGFGQSASEPGPYDMESLADTVDALCERMGLGRIALVGGSMGGVVAQHLVLRHPQRASRLLLVSTGAFTADPATALARADAIAAGEWNDAAVEPMIKGFFRDPPPPEEVARYQRIARSAAKAAAVAAARSNATLRTLERLSEIPIPTLIVQGRYDRARTPEHGALMCERMPNARLLVLENSGHTPQLEEPEAFHAAAVPFLLDGATGDVPG
jgi:pimeloyl-ACP methyl ester carboxylesterase